MLRSEEVTVAHMTCSMERFAAGRYPRPAPIRALVGALAVVWLALVAVPAARAYTPDSPEVKEMIKKAKEFLAEKPDVRVGGKALLATVFAKSGDQDHPFVAKTIGEVKEFVRLGTPAKEDEIYTLGMSIIFLCSLDEHLVDQSRKEIEALHEKLLKKQKPHGGWGYPDKTEGDSSMSQYAALALWEASIIGLDAPVEVWEKLTDWLLRTQSPRGFWGYQAVDPGSYDLVEQTAPTPQSMAAASLGALYICVDHLRLRSANLSDADPDEEAQSAFKRVADKKAATPAKALSSKINMNQLKRALTSGNNWMKSHSAIEEQNFFYYAMYAIERYHSFYKPTAKLDVPWYNEGVKFLKERQAENGSWASKMAATGVSCDTGFAALFLLRSARKSIMKKEAYGAGTLISGRSLDNIGKGPLEMKNGEVRVKALDGPAQEIFAAIDDPSSANYEAAVAALEQLKIEPNDPQLARNRERLRKLAAGAEPEARLAAVAALGKGRQLDDVPMLIYALSDPDPRVVVEARKALEFVSRKFRGLGPADENSQGDVQAAIKRWKQWYLSLRPDAEFIN